MKEITIAEGHTNSIKTDHRNGEETEVQNNFEVRPIIDGFRTITVRDKSKYDRDFVTLFSEDLMNLVVNGEMCLNEWKLLMYLISSLQPDNLAISNLDVIATNLNMHRNNVCKYLKSLIRRKLVIETKIQRRSRTGATTMVFQVPLAQVNYNLCYNGQIMKYKQVRYDHPQITKKDGATLLNPAAETERQKKIADNEKSESLFPELFESENKDKDFE